MITFQNIGGKSNRLLTGPQWATVAIKLDKPHVAVVAIDDNGKRRVGLHFEQDGVAIAIDLPDPVETLGELTEAIEWTAT